MKPNLFSRLITLLLVPCLVAEPLFAVIPCGLMGPRQEHSGVTAMFASQALASIPESVKAQSGISIRVDEETAARLQKNALHWGLELSDTTRVALLIGGQQVDLPIRRLGLQRNAHGFKQMGEDMVILPWAVETLEELNRVLVMIRSSARFVGAVVTSPWKEKVLDLLHVVKLEHRSSRVSASGATNLLFKRNGEIWADSNDGIAFVDVCKREFGVTLEGRRIVILGGGGAGREIAEAILSEKNTDVVISESSDATRKKIAALFADRVTVVDSDSQELEEAMHRLRKGDIVVNATGTGMPGGPFENAPLPIKAEWIPSGVHAFDLLTVPQDSPFLQMARERGAITHVEGARLMSIRTTPYQMKAWMQETLGKSFSSIAFEHLYRVLRDYSAPPPTGEYANHPFRRLPENDIPSFPKQPWGLIGVWGVVGEGSSKVRFIESHEMDVFVASHGPRRLRAGVHLFLKLKGAIDGQRWFNITQKDVVFGPGDSLFLFDENSPPAAIDSKDGPQIVFDVGAGRGSVAARLAEQYPQAKVYAIEPPGFATYLHQLCEHFSNIVPLEVDMTLQELQDWRGKADRVYWFFPYPPINKTLLERAVRLVRPDTGEFILVTEVGKGDTVDNLISLIRGMGMTVEAPQTIPVKEAHVLPPDFRDLMEASETFQGALDGPSMEYPFTMMTILRAKALHLGAGPDKTTKITVGAKTRRRILGMEADSWWGRLYDLYSEKNEKLIRDQLTLQRPGFIADVASLRTSSQRLLESGYLASDGVTRLLAEQLAGGAELPLLGLEGFIRDWVTPWEETTQFLDALIQDVLKVKDEARRTMAIASQAAVELIQGGFEKSLARHGPFNRKDRAGSHNDRSGSLRRALRLVMVGWWNGIAIEEFVVEEIMHQPPEKARPTSAYLKARWELFHNHQEYHHSAPLGAILGMEHERTSAGPADWKVTRPSRDTAEAA